MNVVASLKLRPFNLETKDFLYGVFPLFTLTYSQKQKAEIHKRSSFVSLRSSPWPVPYAGNSQVSISNYEIIVYFENEPFYSVS